MYYYDGLSFQQDVERLALKIHKEYEYVYGVPRGGIALAVALSHRLDLCIMDDLDTNLKNNVLVVDDVIDSGATRLKYEDFDFACLHIKQSAPSIKETPFKSITYVANEQRTEDWIDYWWEELEKPAEDAIIRLIEAIGDNPNREGMKETPARVINSWKQLFCGYSNPEERIQNIFKQFSSDGYDEIVLLKDIEFFSFCEHHMLPFFGKAHIAYIPNKKIVGISKLARLLDIHSRKFQIQERIGEQVTEDIMRYLDAQGAACVIEAQHLCMKMRGVSKQHSVMSTSSMKGAFLNKPAARAELMGLIK